MEYKTYQLLDGSFATSIENTPVDYINSFDISDVEAYNIFKGANISIENGLLVITPIIEYVMDVVEEILDDSIYN